MDQLQQHNERRKELGRLYYNSEQGIDIFEGLSLEEERNLARELFDYACWLVSIRDQSLIECRMGKKKLKQAQHVLEQNLFDVREEVADLTEELKDRNEKLAEVRQQVENFRVGNLATQAELVNRKNIIEQSEKKLEEAKANITEGELKASFLMQEINNLHGAWRKKDDKMKQLKECIVSFSADKEKLEKGLMDMGAEWRRQKFFADVLQIQNKALRDFLTQIIEAAKGVHGINHRYHEVLSNLLSDDDTQSTKIGRAHV